MITGNQRVGELSPEGEVCGGWIGCDEAVEGRVRSQN